MKQSSKAVQKYIITGPVLYFPLLLRLGYGPTLYHIHPTKIAKQLNQAPRLQQILETAISVHHVAERKWYSWDHCPSKRGNVVLQQHIHTRTRSFTVKTCWQVSKHVLFSSMERFCVFFTYMLQHILIEDLLKILQLHMKLCPSHTLEQSMLFLFSHLEDWLLSSIMPQLFQWSVYYFSGPVSTWDSWALMKQRSGFFFPFTLFWKNEMYVCQV